MQYVAGKEPPPIKFAMGFVDESGTYILRIISDNDKREILYDPTFPPPSFRVKRMMVKKLRQVGL